MNNDDYLLKRLGALERAVRSLMAASMQMMPPSLADSISRIGWQWDEELDAINAERAAVSQPPAADSQTGAA